MTAPKRKGRPSTYQPEFCAVVVALGHRGASISQMARAIGVSRSRLYAWEQQHPDFRDAIACARVASQAWWEDLGQRGLIEKDFNAPAYAFEMCRRFPGEYSRDGWSKSAKAENPSAGAGARNTADKTQIERVIVEAPSPPTSLPTNARDKPAGEGVPRSRLAKRPPKPMSSSAP